MINLDRLKDTLRKIDEYYQDHPEELERKQINTAWDYGYHDGWYLRPNDGKFSSNPKVQKEYDWAHWLGWRDRQTDIAWDNERIDLPLRT